MITPIILFNTRLTLRTRFRCIFNRFLRSLFFFFPTHCAGDAVIVCLACFAGVPGGLVVDALAEVAGWAGEDGAGGGGDVGMA